jgi:hypothetical protein
MLCPLLKLAHSIESAENVVTPINVTHCSFKKKKSQGDFDSAKFSFVRLVIGGLISVNVSLSGP